MDIITIVGFLCMIVIGAIALYNVINGGKDRVAWTGKGYILRLLECKVRYDCYAEIEFENVMPNVSMNDVDFYIGNERIKVDILSWDRQKMVIRYEGKKDNLKKIKCVVRG